MGSTNITLLNSKIKQTGIIYPVIILILASSFYFYEFVLQVAPNVMTDSLMKDFGIKAAGLGTLSAFFYYGYTPMQIPAGLLYDRFGPRFLLSIAATICGGGAILFGFSHDIFFAGVGRFLVGTGSTFAFIGCLVLISRWFPARIFPLLSGCIMAMSAAGAMVGELPLAAAVARFGWRDSIIFLGLTGIIIAVLIGLIVRDSPTFIKIKQSKRQGSELQRLLEVCRRPQSWFLGIYAFCSWAPILVICGLWGVPFIRQLYQISTKEASIGIMVVWAAIGLGSPIVGWWSEKIRSRRIPLSLCMAIGLVASLIFIYVPNVPYSVMMIVLFAFGLAASAQILSFSLVKDNNPPRIVGTAIGFNNMMVVAGGLIFQPLVGILLNMSWDGFMLNDVPVYMASDYRQALFIVPLCFFVGLIISLFLLKETHCQPQYDAEDHIE